MSLIDTTDRTLMLGAYGWAFVKPIRKLYYNLTITIVSAIVAIFIGCIETLGLIAGIELASRPDAPGRRAYDIFVDCFERGLLVRVTGDIIALSPPLIIDRDQIGDMAGVLRAAINRAA